MKKEIKYVECNWCDNWTPASRLNTICQYCDNSKQVIDPATILCNLCGECMCPLDTHNAQIPHGLYDAEVIGGYDSYHLLDLSSYNFNLCEKCLRELFMKCKIKPEIHYVNIGGGEMDPPDWDHDKMWEQDQTSYEYNLWTDNGGHHQAYLNKKCNTVKDCPNAAKYTVMYSRENDFSEHSCCEEHKARRQWAINARFVPFISNVLKTFL